MTAKALKYGGGGGLVNLEALHVRHTVLNAVDVVAAGVVLAQGDQIHAPDDVAAVGVAVVPGQQLLYPVQLGRRVLRDTTPLSTA